MSRPTTSRAALPLYLVSDALSMFGNSAIMIVLPWLVLSRTGDAAVAGSVAAATALPAIAAALVGGWLIDRVGQRRMSVLADLGSAAAVAALPVVDRLVGLDVGWFIALGILGALFDTPGMTARETLLARVSRSSGVAVDRIVAIRETTFGLAFLGGPALAGLLIALLDPITVVWITAACSASAALVTAVLPLGPATAEAHDARALGGLATIRREPALRAMLVIGFGSALVIPPLVAVALPAHFQALGEPGWYGATMSTFAVGSLVGAALFAVVGRRSRRRAFVLGTVLQTAGMAIFSILHGIVDVAAGMLLLGVGSGLISPVVMVFFTEQVREAVRGRVLGLFNAVSLAASPLGLGAYAWLVAGFDLHAATLVVVGVWVLVAGFALTTPALRTLGPAQPQEADVDEELIGADD